MRGSKAKKIRRQCYGGRNFRERHYTARETGYWTVQISPTLAAQIPHFTVEADPYRQLYQEAKRDAVRKDTRR